MKATLAAREDPMWETTGGTPRNSPWDLIEGDPRAQALWWVTQGAFLESSFRR